jgi:hypothetical protein
MDSPFAKLMLSEPFRMPCVSASLNIAWRFIIKIHNPLLFIIDTALALGILGGEFIRFANGASMERLACMQTPKIPELPITFQIRLP